MMKAYNLDETAEKADTVYRSLNLPTIVTDQLYHDLGGFQCSQRSQI